MSIFDVPENENEGLGGKGRSASHRMQALIFLFSSETEILGGLLDIVILPSERIR
jgi:hypothetical protein